MPDASMNVLNDFRHGDIDAFEALFRQHQRAVYGWILRVVRNPATAEELTVETFWRIYQAHARFDPARSLKPEYSLEPERSFEPWARRIATRVALDHLRTGRPECELPAEIAAPVSADAAVSAEIRLKTAQALGRLPPKLRIAAILAVVEELPHKEVAAALGISVAAVKLRVFRALRILRKDLEHQGITP